MKKKQSTNNYYLGKQHSRSYSRGTTQKKLQACKNLSKNWHFIIIHLFLTSFNSNTIFFTGNNNEKICVRFLQVRRERRKIKKSEPSTTHNRRFVVAAMWKKVYFLASAFRCNVAKSMRPPFYPCIFQRGFVVCFLSLFMALSVGIIYFVGPVFPRASICFSFR